MLQLQMLTISSRRIARNRRVPLSLDRSVVTTSGEQDGTGPGLTSAQRGLLNLMTIVPLELLAGG